MRMIPASLAFVLLACGDHEPAQEPTSNGAMRVTEVVPDTLDPDPTVGSEPGSRAHGRIVGRVRLLGDPPLRPPVPGIRGTAGCVQAGHAAPLLEGIIADEMGGLANVVVSVLGTPDPPPPNPDPLQIDQVECVFVPHVAAVQAGRGVEVSNSDPISHNVRLVARRNPSVNITIGPGGEPRRIALPKSETCALVCDMHPWMGAHVVVLPHPWFSVSSPDGSFAIVDLPAGTYDLEAWHEEMGTLRLSQVEVPAGGVVEVEVVFEP